MFPAKAPWVNVAPLRMDKQRGRPVLVEFFDFLRVPSLRTLPYLKAWHERYEHAGLRVIQVHCGGYEASRDEDAIREAVARLGIEHPVLIDSDFRVWQAYGNEGWPSRYLWYDLRLFEAHAGEGGYLETEAAIRELLGDDGDDVGLLRPEDDPEALLVVPTDDVEGAYNGPYAAGGVWGVFAGAGEVVANGLAMQLTAPGAFQLVWHERHTEAELTLEIGAGVECLATVFTPGLA
ncbi:MAG TPA: DipZ protein [Solirubrobacteraceae bacterium]